MTADNNTKIILKIQPVTPKRWADFELVMGPRGACGGCWCMSWRLSKSQFEKQKGATNKQQMKKLISNGEIPGILAYHKKQPIAWCSVAPRDCFPRLDKARTLKRVDDSPVWSIVCLYILKEYRRMGVSSRIIKAAAEYAVKKGGHIVEAYPVEMTDKSWPDPFLWTGTASAYRAAGFKEVLRRSPTRPIMRYYGSPEDA